MRLPGSPIFLSDITLSDEGWLKRTHADPPFGVRAARFAKTSHNAHIWHYWHAFRQGVIPSLLQDLLHHRGKVNRRSALPGDHFSVGSDFAEVG